MCSLRRLRVSRYCKSTRPLIWDYQGRVNCGILAKTIKSNKDKAKFLTDSKNVFCDGLNSCCWDLLISTFWKTSKITPFVVSDFLVSFRLPYRLRLSRVIFEYQGRFFQLLYLKPQYSTLHFSDINGTKLNPLRTTASVEVDTRSPPASETTIKVAAAKKCLCDPYRT
jgi:hypothetical protein